MSTRCDNCNGEILVPATGTINGVAFNFCSPHCRAEFGDFSGRIGHAMVIPAATCDERDNSYIGPPMFLVTQTVREPGLEETAGPSRPASRVLVSHYSTCKGENA